MGPNRRRQKGPEGRAAKGDRPTGVAPGEHGSDDGERRQRAQDVEPREQGLAEQALDRYG